MGSLDFNNRFRYLNESKYFPRANRSLYDLGNSQEDAMTKAVAWLDEHNKDFVALMAVLLLDHPEYSFSVVEDTLCIVERNKESV